MKMMDVVATIIGSRSMMREIIGSLIVGFTASETTIT